MKKIGDAILPEGISWSKRYNVMNGYTFNGPGEFMYFTLIALYLPLEGREIRVTGQANRWTAETGEKKIATFGVNCDTWEEAAEHVKEKYEEWVKLFEDLRETPALLWKGGRL